MRILKRRDPLERVLDSVGHSLDVTNGSSKGIMKAGLLTAGGLAGLTAASAGISSLRRRSEAADR